VASLAQNIQRTFNSREEAILLIQGSSERLPLNKDSVDYIVTDPPYFDSVQYGDLARFFHVWLNQMPA
jgi:adenine-specific DNA methylase